MPEPTNVILCAGGIDYRELPVASSRSNAMVPVNGRPVIGWILDDLLRKGIGSATVVVRTGEEALHRFLERVYAWRMDLRVRTLERSESILHSLRIGLGKEGTNEGLLRIILGDTLIRDPFEGEDDFLYAGLVKSPRKWCVVVTDGQGRITGYLDKLATAQAPRLAAAGYYHLIEGSLARRCLDEALTAGEKELSALLRRYGEIRGLRAEKVEQWYDFGHIETLVDARLRLLQPRHFNAVTVDPLLKTITKSSSHDAKLRDEFLWYLTIPDDLKLLCPRIVRHDEVDGRLRLTQEYYGYPSLAELYVYGDIHVDTWDSILGYVLQVHNLFRKYPGALSDEDVRFMYDGKVWERLERLRRQDSGWEHTLAAPVIRYNGRALMNVATLKDAVARRTEALVGNVSISVVHGDLCFSNILFDINNQIIRLIDPRGSFGRQGVMGDPRYDIAKLRHSTCSFYDSIVAGLFSLEGEGDTFEGKLYLNESSREVARRFDRVLSEAGYDLDEIRLIEALLFISMVPLHSDHPRRQRFLYLTGLNLLNEVLT